MGGIDSLLFLKVLCALEKKKIDTAPDEAFIQEASAPEEQLDGKGSSPCFVRIYMQEKYGTGGSVGSKRYVCPRCSCLFRHKRHLRQHLQFHCNHKCLGCSECYANILRSFKRVGGQKLQLSKTFSCSACPSSFLTQAGLAIHEECHPQPDQVLKCESCSQQFDNRSELVKHRKMHLTSEVYKCKHCAKAFATASNLAKHVVARHRKDEVRLGNHFLAELPEDPSSDKEQSDEDESDEVEFEEASSKECPLCNKKFKYGILNRAHKCSEFPLPENIREDMFDENCFQCPACSQIYSSYLALKMHWGAHIGLDPLTCFHCDKKFAKLRSINLHFELHGKNTCKKCGVFFYRKLSVLLHHCGYTQRCFVCDQVFPTRSGYTRHLSVHPLPKDFVYKCTKCKKSFLKESYFRAHQIDHTGTYPFVCSLCDEKFLTFGPFKKHALTHVTTQNVKCKLCPLTFRSAQLLNAHSASHGVKPEHCSQTFETDSALQNDDCKVEPDTSGFECRDCNKVFRKQYQLFIHLRDYHRKAPPYLLFCDLCQRGFYHRLHMQSHRQTCSQRNEAERKHISIEKKRKKENIVRGRTFQCPSCPRKYFSQLHLDRHVYVHRGDSECPYQCPKCGTGYVQEHYRDLHVIKCNKSKSQFKCTMCRATFRTEKTYNRHAKVHGNELECSLCGDKFITKRGYDKHKTLCTPESAKYKTFRRPPTKLPPIFTCPTCDRTFQLQYRFLAHIASHQGIKQYQCPTCFHTFMSSNNFKRHKCKFQLKPEAVEND